MFLSKHVPYKLRFNPLTFGISQLRWLWLVVWAVMSGRFAPIYVLMLSCLLSLSAQTVGMPGCLGNSSPSWGPFPGCLYAFSAQNPGWGTSEGKVPSQLKCSEAHSDHFQVRSSPSWWLLREAPKAVLKIWAKIRPFGEPHFLLELYLLSSVL